MESKSEELKRKSRERRLGTCKHFTGLIYESCKNKIVYNLVRIKPEELKDEAPAFQYAYACFKKDDKFFEAPHPCAFREFYNEEEIDAQDKERLEKLNQYFKDVENDICPNHKTPMVQKQIGSCIYAMPCGCRIGQGKLSKNYKPKYPDLMK